MMALKILAVAAFFELVIFVLAAFISDKEFARRDPWFGYWSQVWVGHQIFWSLIILVAVGFLLIRFVIGAWT